MTSSTEAGILPKQAIHPGRYVVDELEERGLPCENLASLMQRPPKSIDRILRGRAPITKPLAQDLESALGLPAAVMRRLQERYDETLKHLAADPAMPVDIQLLGEIPWREFAKRGWIRDLGTDVERVDELRAHYDVRTLSEIQETELAAAFRITKGTDVNSWALAGWLQEGEWQALERQASSDSGIFPSFIPELFKASLPKMREMTRAESFWPALRNQCAAAGVALEFVPHVPKSGANGVTHWLHEDSPLIQLSLFRKRADIFWFTFFHEAAHVILHEQQRVFINLDERLRTDAQELEADQFAADTLIPPQFWEPFQDAGCFDSSSIHELAESIDVHPGIVVGRLQKQELIRNNWHNALRMSYDESMFTD